MEKIDGARQIQPMSPMEYELFNKINELVDAVNKLPEVKETPEDPKKSLESRLLGAWKSSPNCYGGLWQDVATEARKWHEEQVREQGLVKLSKVIDLVIDSYTRADAVNRIRALAEKEK